MKTILEYINEALVFEGGHSVDGVEPIRGDLAKNVADEIIEQIKKKFKCECAALGSTGKKGANQTSGDIDIALELSWDKKDDVIDFVKEQWSDSPFGNIVDSLHVFNIGYKYDEDGKSKLVQVDFMFVDNVDFAKFCYHSPSFINNESQFKGAWRTQLMIGCINCLDAETVLGKEYAPTYFTKDDYDGSYVGEIKTMWRILFSKTDGLKLKQVSYEGKNKPIKNPKTAETKTYTKDINKILKLCFGKDATQDTMNSYETILDYISSDKYIWRSKEQLEKTKNWLFTNTDLLSDFSNKVINDAKKLFDDAILCVK